MAKKSKNQTIVIEDVELKPQVIGMTYQKKSNLPRIIFIFVALILVVYFIDDISLFVNNLLGRKTAETIQIKAEENIEKRQNNNGNNDLENNNQDDNKLITCNNGDENIEYKFVNNELYEIKYTKTDNNVNDANYNSRYMTFQNKKNEHDQINGIVASLSKTESGFTYNVMMSLPDINGTVKDNYYFNYKESSEAVLAKMLNTGYSCN